jgi:hypothetical protein
VGFQGGTPNLPETAQVCTSSGAGALVAGAFPPIAKSQSQTFELFLSRPYPFPFIVLAWRRELPHFAAALEQALAERDLMHRERAIALVDQAYQTLGDILGNDKASPSLQFQAAKFIIEQATPKIPPERKQRRTAAKPAPVGPQMAANCTKMHNAAGLAGFSEACPCGSGKKFNDRCLSKFLAGAA